MIDSIVIASLVLLAIYVGNRRLSGFETFGVLALLVFGVLLVVFPNLSTTIADALGIDDGSDLILDFAVLGGLFIVSNFYFRFKRTEATLIAVTRELAIVQARRPPQSSPDAGA